MAACVSLSSLFASQLRGRESLKSLLRLSLSHLSVSDLGSAAVASAAWREVVNSPGLWDILLHRDFKEQCINSYERYKSLSPKLHRTSICEYDVMLRLVLLGDTGAGKTKFLIRFADQVFHEPFVSTIGIDFRIAHIRQQGFAVKLQLWDTAGAERFRTVSLAYTRNADGFLIFYDQSDPGSLAEVSKWYDIATRLPRSKPFFAILCASKCDLPAAVPIEEGKAVAASLGIPLVETSSKTNVGIDRAVALLVQQCLTDPPPNPILVTSVSTRKTVVARSCPMLWADLVSWVSGTRRD